MTEDKTLDELRAIYGEVPVEPEDNGAKKSQTDMIVDLVTKRCDLFRDKNRTAYALIKATGETYYMGSGQFQDWLLHSFYIEHGTVVREQALREARMTLRSLAMQERRPVHTRVAEVDGEYWLDLGEAGSGQAVRLRPGGWSVEAAKPTFVRSNSAQALPHPIAGGEINLLWKIANIPEDARLLVIAWLVECLRPDTPYPVLELLGEHGSAKSTAQTALRRLIDPNDCDLRGIPKCADDLFVSGGANHMLSFENVSFLPAPIQDALCITATGGGYAKRRLYTDEDEAVITLKRPVVLNGIAATVTQQDLVSRAITVELTPITDAREIQKLASQHEAYRARILGGLLDIAAKALTYLPDMKLPAAERPRLIEFAYLGMAVAKAMGKDPAEFMRQFNEARQDGVERTIDASPVASAIRDWCEVHPGQYRELPVKDLRVLLADYRPAGDDKWPASAKAFGDALRRAAPALRQLGIECRSLGKIGGVVKWRVASTEKINSQNPSPECPASPAATFPEPPGRTCDAESPAQCPAEPVSEKAFINNCLQDEADCAEQDIRTCRTSISGVYFSGGEPAQQDIDQHAMSCRAWRLTYYDRPPEVVTTDPPATRAQMLADWPGAIDAQPMDREGAP